MSDARRYAVWPDPRSRSRSLKGSRPSVPHGTNFLCLFKYVSNQNNCLMAISRTTQISFTNMSHSGFLSELRVMDLMVTAGAIKHCKAQFKLSPPTNQHIVNQDCIKLHCVSKNSVI